MDPYKQSNNIRLDVFFNKEHLYKELEAEKGSKNKEFLRNWPGWNNSSNLFGIKYNLKNKEPIKELWGSDSLNK